MPNDTPELDPYVPDVDEMEAIDGHDIFRWDAPEDGVFDFRSLTTHDSIEITSAPIAADEETVTRNPVESEQALRDRIAAFRDRLNAQPLSRWSPAANAGFAPDEADDEHDADEADEDAYEPTGTIETEVRINLSRETVDWLNGVNDAIQPIPASVEPANPAEPTGWAPIPGYNPVPTGRIRSEPLRYEPFTPSVYGNRTITWTNMSTNVSYDPFAASLGAPTTWDTERIVTEYQGALNRVVGVINERLSRVADPKWFKQVVRNGVVNLPEIGWLGVESVCWTRYVGAHEIRLEFAASILQSLGLRTALSPESVADLIPHVFFVFVPRIAIERTSPTTITLTEMPPTEDSIETNVFKVSGIVQAESLQMRRAREVALDRCVLMTLEQARACMDAIDPIERSYTERIDKLRLETIARIEDVAGWYAQT